MMHRPLFYSARIYLNVLFKELHESMRQFLGYSWIKFLDHHRRDEIVKEMLLKMRVKIFAPITIVSKDCERLRTITHKYEAIHYSMIKLFVREYLLVSFSFFLSFSFRVSLCATRIYIDSCFLILSRSSPFCREKLTEKKRTGTFPSNVGAINLRYSRKSFREVCQCFQNI